MHGRSDVISASIRRRASRRRTLSSKEVWDFPTQFGNFASPPGTVGGSANTAGSKATAGLRQEAVVSLRGTFTERGRGRSCRERRWCSTACCSTPTATANFVRTKSGRPPGGTRGGHQRLEARFGQSRTPCSPTGRRKLPDSRARQPDADRRRRPARQPPRSSKLRLTPRPGALPGVRDCSLSRRRDPGAAGRLRGRPRLGLTSKPGAVPAHLEAEPARTWPQGAGAVCVFAVQLPTRPDRRDTRADRGPAPTAKAWTGPLGPG